MTRASKYVLGPNLLNGMYIGNFKVRQLLDYQKPILLTRTIKLHQLAFTILKMGIKRSFQHERSH